MNNLAALIGDSIYVIIGVLAVITIAGFAYVVMQIGKLQHTMDEDHKKTRGRADYTSGGYLKNPDIYTWEETLDYLDIFNKIQLKYSVFEQFVPIFPLLGILGTVAGLMQKLGNIGDMQSALGTSIGTTFWGLIAAISLKLIDAILVSNTVDKMGLFFETFEQNYQFAKDKHLEEMNNQQ